MIKRLGQKFRRDNRGSAIVVVMVTMAFIVVLTSVLLYLSLVNIQMKNLDRSGKKSFYSAEAVMNEVRANVQFVVSEAINTAYTDLLNNFNNYPEEEREARFTAKFYDALYTQPIQKSDEENAPAYSIFKSDSKYYPAQLAALVGEIPGAELYDPLTDAAEKDVYHAGDGSYITLRDVVVRYTTSKGFYTTVTADIKIETPKLKNVSSTVTYSSVPDFTIIANGTLEAASTSAAVTGNAYAGLVTVGGHSGLSVADSDNFVCAGDVTVENDASLTFADTANLWAKGVFVGSGGAFASNGDAYVANDLNLTGQGASATLSGRYFGYGNGTGEDGDETPAPDLSSSIVVNALKTHLNMTGLKTLVLAGHSFVDYGLQDYGSYVMMGQSVAVKSDQLAYLVPGDYLNVSNPFSYTSEEHPGGFTNEQLAAEEFITLDESLEQYGITNPLTDILYMRKPVGQTNLIYFCFKFPTPEDANRYFADYFTAHSEEIQKYLNLYCSSYSLADSPILGAAGGVYDTDSEGALSLLGATAIPPATLEAIRTSYSNLCVTLTRTEDDSDAESPYYYYVNTGELASAGTGALPLNGEDRVVVTTSADYRVSLAAPTVNVIIASGSVTVDRDFTGLIIAGGDVTLNAAVTASRELVAEALQALVNPDGNGYLYLNPEHISPAYSSKDSDIGSIWDLSALVTYENWTKNEE